METASRSGITWGWLGVFIGAQVADIATTAASLRFGGVEANPLVLRLIARGGIGGYAWVRLGAIAVGIGLLYLAGCLRRWLPERSAALVSRSLATGLQVGAAVQLIAVAANLVAMSSEMGA
jgi:hypothetical protein